MQKRVKFYDGIRICAIEYYKEPDKSNMINKNLVSYICVFKGGAWCIGAEKPIFFSISQ